MAHPVQRQLFPPSEASDEAKREGSGENRPLIIWLSSVKEHAECGSSESRRSLLQLKNTIPQIDKPSETLTEVIRLVKNIAKIINMATLGSKASEALRELGVYVPAPSPIDRCGTPILLQ